MRPIFVLVAVPFLVGCAGRSPQPVAVVQPQDQFMDCTAIIAEVNSNNQKVQELASEKGMKTTQNVAAVSRPPSTDVVAVRHDPGPPTDNGILPAGPRSGLRQGWGLAASSLSDDCHSCPVRAIEKPRSNRPRI